MKQDELQKMSIEQLQAVLLKKKEEFRMTRFEHASGQLANTSTLRKIKKDVARILTLMNKQG